MEPVRTVNFMSGEVPSKFEIAENANHIANMVGEGDMSALQALAKLKAIEELAKMAQKQIAEFALVEAQRYDAKSFTEFDGVKFEIRETGTRYDYSQDGEWQSYHDALKDIEAHMKGREETLKKLGQCSKTSTTSVVVTLKK